MNRPVLVLIAFADLKWRSWKVDGTGVTTQLAAGEIAHDPLKLITLKAESTEEWWADASMLTLTRRLDSPEAVSLDFGWLFGTDTPDIKTSLSHDGLRGMVEAQARLISVSPLS